jgi:hypothetical protein
MRKIVCSVTLSVRKACPSRLMQRSITSYAHTSSPASAGSSNATRQALEIAGATQERRLFPVACTRLLGPTGSSRLGKRFLTPLRKKAV